MATSLAQMQRQATLRPPWTGGSLMRLPRLWLERHAWRKELATLDAEQIRDCGFNPRDVRREAAKPFWRA
jgi:uncharacterized protein YjiS (DUF1127 family)